MGKEKLITTTPAHSKNRVADDGTLKIPSFYSTAMSIHGQQQKRFVAEMRGAERFLSRRASFLHWGPPVELEHNHCHRNTDTQACEN